MRLALVTVIAFAIAFATVSPATAASIDFGPIAGELIALVVGTIGAVLATALAGLIVRTFARFGIDIEETRRRRLKNIIENGIRLGAARLDVSLDERLTFDVRNRIVAEAASHLARHGATTIRKLREDPEDVALLRDIVTAHGGWLLGIGRQQGEAA